MKYSVVLIDLDDTLLDFGAASSASLKSLMESCGRRISPCELGRFEEINAGCWRELEKGLITRDELSKKRFEIFFSELGLEYDPLEANTRFRLGLSESAVLMPGALELCQKLSKMCSLYVVTNGFMETQARRIKTSGLEGLFDGVFASQAIGYTKPDPRFFAYVLNSLGHDKKDKTIILGDSLSSDIEGGTSAGIDTCWYNPKELPGGEECSYIISSLDDFIPLVMKSK
ncbi:MAG: YjjG family noncanonical pyrimidine nucleotidase [Clostridiaceae bacterium]|nr:YjjG family noncanonical pyrimidine nucleotidase [Clostridiaceae bacterium]